MLSINTNLSSLIAQGSMKSSTNKLNQAIERMTTGFKINHAKDNAANYSISTNMTTKIGAYNVAEDNAAMGLDLISTAEGTLSQIEDKLQRLRALQEQASNGTYGEQSLNAINAEANALVDEINRLYSTAEYNGLKLFGSEEASQAAPIAMFAMNRSATSENYFIADPISYTDEEVAAMTTMTEAVANTSLVSGGTYSISTVHELVALADYVNSGKGTTNMTFVLGADIDLSSIDNWTPIGTSSNIRFQGTFDGNGHTISNLTIDSTSGYIGLFGSVYKATVKNLGLSNAEVSGVANVGGLIGYCLSSTVTNCYISGNISATGGQTGGLVGFFSSSNMSNCYSTGSVSCSSTSMYAATGGLIGQGQKVYVNNSYSTSSVSNTAYYTGGLIGTLLLNSSSEYLYMDNCYATGDVIGTSYVGGLVGNLTAGSTNIYINSCYAIGNVYSSDSSKGGLIGGFYGYSGSCLNISNSYTTQSSVGFVSTSTSSYLSTTNCASVKRSTGTTQMTLEEIQATYTLDYMGLSETDGWTIGSDGNPVLATTYSRAPSGGVTEPDVGGDDSGGTDGGSDAGTTTPSDPSTPSNPSNPTGPSQPSFTPPSYAPDTIMLQIGALSNWASQVGVSTKFTLLGVDDLRMIGLDLTTDYLTQIDDMLELVSEKQTHFGAVSNRLESVLEEITIQRDNLVSSRSTIRDADIAEVSSHYIQQQILQQASATLLATANQSPSIALQLI